MLKPEFQIPQNQFLEKIVIPFVCGGENKQIYSVVYDLGGKIVFASQPVQKYLDNYNTGRLIGQTAPEVGKFLVKELDSAILEQLEQIRKRVIQEETSIRYFLILNTLTTKVSLSVLHFPLFYYDGTVVGTRTIAGQFKWINPRKFTLLNKDDSENYANLKLTQRQREVLFLLITGLPQQNIAEILNISRGTVSSCISNLCKKFNVQGQSESLLTQIASTFPFSDVPSSIIKSKVIVLPS